MATKSITTHRPEITYAAIGWCFALLMAASAAFAHDPGLSTCDLLIQARSIVAYMTMARSDVEALVPLDTDRDGAVSTAEFLAASPRLKKIASTAWNLRIGEESVSAETFECVFDPTNNVHFTVTFPAGTTGKLSARCQLLHQLPRGHRTFVRVMYAAGNLDAQALLNAERDVVTANVSGSVQRQQDEGTSFNTFIAFLKLGVEHIVTGYDHLLFLFALLLVIPTLRSAAIIITCFTVAHSITLGLSTLGVVQVPSKVVESLIAATIVYVGVENLFVRDVHRWRWLLTLTFGLLHGFGFAGVLREMNIASTPHGAAIPLLSFNLGVELGQIAIAAIVLPILWSIRRRPAFTHRWVPSLSIFISALGTWWLFDRL